MTAAVVSLSLSFYWRDDNDGDGDGDDDEGDDEGDGLGIHFTRIVTTEMFFARLGSLRTHSSVRNRILAVSYLARRLGRPGCLIERPDSPDRSPCKTNLHPI
jgi:hypothetical protein